MSIFDGILNNREAADYLTERGFKIDAPMLSKLTSANSGPRFEKATHGKYYRKEWLDEFLTTIDRVTTNEANNG